MSRHSLRPSPLPFHPVAGTKPFTRWTAITRLVRRSDLHYRECPRPKLANSLRNAVFTTVRCQPGCKRLNFSRKTMVPRPTPNLHRGDVHMLCSNNNPTSQSDQSQEIYLGPNLHMHESPASRRRRNGNFWKYWLCCWLSSLRSYAHHLNAGGPCRV